MLYYSILATEKDGSRGITMTVRVQWKLAKGKKVEAALKKLKPEYSDRYLKVTFHYNSHN